MPWSFQPALPKPSLGVECVGSLVRATASHSLARSEEFRCKMVKRGIAAGPSEPESALRYDNGGCSLPANYSPLKAPPPPPPSVLRRV